MDDHPFTLFSTLPKLSVWRAATDNDHVDGNSRLWDAAGFRKLSSSLVSSQLEQSSHSIIFIEEEQWFTVGHRYVFTTHSSYQLFGCSIVHFSSLIRFPMLSEVELISFKLPRIGYHWKLPTHFSLVRWYGRGPYDNYIDRLHGADVGIYSALVDELYHPYIFPQAHGNHCDVRWVSMRDPSSRCGLLFYVPLSSARWFQFTASKYSDRRLAQASHTHQLIESTSIHLHIDLFHSGVGNGSCGPGILPHYSLSNSSSSSHPFDVYFTPLLPDDDETVLAKLIPN